MFRAACLARVVTRSPQFSHCVPLLKSLHWLPVQSSIIFTRCTSAYQTLTSREPSYLFSMLPLAPKPRELRSSGFHLLSVPRVKTDAGTRPFSIVVPTVWNSLCEYVKSSNSIVSFCHHLKTHPFRLAYPSQLSTTSDQLLMNFALYLKYGLRVCPTSRLGPPLSSIIFKDIGAIEVV